MSEELIYLTRCCQLIEEKWQHGESRFWKNGDYQQLSELVSTATRISISADTLKRLFGKIKTYRSYNPQMETKNALAIFIGYEGWEAFKRGNPLVQGVPKQHLELEGLVQVPAALMQKPMTATDTHPTVMVSQPMVQPEQESGGNPGRPAPHPLPVRKPRHYGRATGLALGVLLLAVCYLIFAARAPLLPATSYDSDSEGRKVVFNAKVARGTVPHTVVFQYDISHLKSDSVYIDYGYSLFGYREKELLPHDKHLITHYYHFPGVYPVRLLAGQRVLDTLEVEVLSQGWSGAIYLKNNRLESISGQVMNYSNGREGRLHPPMQQIQAFGIDTALVDWLELSNIRYFNVNGDHFALETRFRNNPTEGGFACLESMIRVLGEHNLFRIQFNQPGCARWATVQFGENEFDGKFNDLSPFSTQVSQWRVARLEVSNQRVKVLLDGKLVYQAVYQQPVGKIRGIIYNFRGSGSVDYVRMYDAHNKLAYEDEFEE